MGQPVLSSSAEDLIVRFGKRTRSWVPGRGLFGERKESATTVVEHEERSALLGEPPAREQPAETTPRDVSDTTPAADPTQRLLTALGRFQRQVVRAERGAPQAEWCDDCMEQLVTGIKIAHAEGWRDVKQALTDTARILHSCESVGQARQCVTFLEDAYEILCLMVGDLIVDSTRSGVIQKWRHRYAQALNDLERQGIAIIDDDGEAEDPGDAAGDSSVEALDQDAGDAGDPAEAVFPPLEAPPIAAEDAAAAPPALTDAVESEHDAESFFQTPGAPVSEPEERAEPPMPFDALEGDAAVHADADTEAFSGDDFFPPLDSLLPDEEEEDTPTADAEAAVTPAFDMPVSEEPLPVADETGPEETGSAPEPEEDALFAALDGELRAAREALVPAGESAPAAQAEPAGEPEYPEGSPEALLQTMKRAYAAGDVAEAKHFALQLAADMARLEVERADSRRGNEQRLLEENAAAIAAAREHVRESCAGVEEIRARILKRESDRETKSAEAEAYRGRIQEHEAKIADIEAQIRQLEAERESEREQLGEVQEELDRALGDSERIHADIVTLAEAEAHAQEAQTHAERRLEALESERDGREAALAEAGSVLESQHAALAEIERTIAAVRGEQPSESASEASEEDAGPLDAAGPPENGAARLGEENGGEEAGSEHAAHDAAAVPDEAPDPSPAEAGQAEANAAPASADTAEEIDGDGDGDSDSDGEELLPDAPAVRADPEGEGPVQGELLYPFPGEDNDRGEEPARARGGG